ncbi:UbiD family decarboxylase [Gorillibacterium massiliense]|uniref:UbiD family decarboxylase n=1 Tax=Gorillibacterium massiliense TaxID=1280390 RepID=UPI0004B10709|nr:UbiD family decarboxylase [Gorillibacterium massiliense]
MHLNLRQFLDVLRRENDLAVISAPVDPYLELAEIHRRVIENEGPALLFTNVKGSSFPVVTNLFGTPRRVDLAFGPRPEQFMKRAVGALDTLLPPTFKGLWGQKDLMWDALKVGMKTVQTSAAPVLQVCDRNEPLSKLPVLTCWQEDGGPFLTLPLVYTEHPDTGHHNLGMYRVQVYDGHTTGMHWQIHKGGGFHHHAAEQRNAPLPTTVFLGGPPALIASAIAPVPEALPELLLASLIIGKKLDVANDPLGGPHRLVSEAEFAICGYVPPHERRPEGPFGDHYGYYSLVHDFPVFHVDKVFHRKDAIYPATIVGKPPQEDYYLGEFLQRLLSPAYSIVMPGVKDLWAYAESGAHSLASAIVRESYKREAITWAFSILGQGQLALTKFLIVTDKPVDLSNFKELLETVLERFDPFQDLFIFNYTAHDTLDYTGHKLNHGSKATMLGIGEKIRELPGQYLARDLSDVGGITGVKPYCRGCLVVSGSAYEADPELPARIVDRAGDRLAEWPLVILADDLSATEGQTKFLWTVFTRFNPASDIYAKSHVKRNHIGYELPLVIDCRMKPGYPDELFPREDVVATVDKRWKEYFPG